LDLFLWSEQLEKLFLVLSNPAPEPLRQVASGDANRQLASHGADCDIAIRKFGK
jgi:hypothetical protein